MQIGHLIFDPDQQFQTIEAISQTVDALQTAGVSVHARIAAIESCWYMRNQLLRDTDWSSMAHGLEVRVPFVDATLLERLGPAIASDRPPNKHDLAACSQTLSQAILGRDKTGFTTPVRGWIGITDRTSRLGRAPECDQGALTSRAELTNNWLLAIEID